MGDADSVPVKTYVPPYQKERWREHADQLGMSQSEFVRTMTQAGKRGFDEAVSSGAQEKHGEDPSSSPDSGGSRLEERVLSSLSTDEYCEWDELVQAVQNEFEDELGATIDDLLDEGGYDGGELLREVLRVARAGSEYGGDDLARLHVLAGEADLDITDGLDDRIHLTHLLAAWAAGRTELRPDLREPAGA